MRAYPIALHTRLYLDRNVVRAAELRTCFELNAITGFSTIVFYSTPILPNSELDRFIEGELKELAFLYGLRLIIDADYEEIPTFNQIIKTANRHTPDHINVVANSDIAFPSASVVALQGMLTNRDDLAIILSRWDMQDEGGPVFFDRADSQDVWAWKGTCKGLTSIDFTLGKAGCDNRFAWELQRMGYMVVNKGKSIMTLHFHRSNVRHYSPNDPVPPPYLTIQPE